MTSHIESSALSLATKEAGVFVGAVEKGLSAGLAMGVWESLNNMDVTLSFMDGGLLAASIGFTHTFLEGIIKIIETFMPGVVLSEADMLSVDAAGNLTSSLAYAIFSRLLGGWSPYDGDDHLSSLFVNALYAFALTSGSEFIVAKIKSA